MNSILRKCDPVYTFFPLRCLIKYISNGDCQFHRAAPVSAICGYDVVINLDGLQNSLQQPFKLQIEHSFARTDFRYCWCSNCRKVTCYEAEGTLEITWFTYTQPVPGLILKYSGSWSNMVYVMTAFTPWSSSWATARRKLVPTGVSSRRKSLKR